MTLTVTSFLELFFIIDIGINLLQIGVFAKLFATQMSPTVIETQHGKLRGVLITLTNRQLPQVEAYLSLQYASLLGGELRFMPPTGTTEKWDGVRVALKFRPVCPQRVPSLDELALIMPRVRVQHFSRILPFLERQSEECLNHHQHWPVCLPARCHHDE